MDIALIAARAVQFAAAISLAGVFGFVALVAPQPSVRLRRSLLRLAWISLALVLLSGPFRLFFVGQNMTGYSIAEAIAHHLAWLVLTGTQFGHAALFRLAALVMLVPFVAMIGRRRSFDLVGTALAATGLAAMAWQGHAGADLGWHAVIHLSADMGHLIAAGLWLGALLPLALLLREEADARDHYEVARRFSSLGVACVAVLLASGVVNAWYLIGSVPALFGTAYGQTLLIKLALVAGLLWLAAVNRWRLLPRLASGGDRAAATRLARHAVIEAMLGLAVIAVVAALGTMVPAAHEQIDWPFAYRLDFGQITTASLRLQLIATAALALLGLVVALFGIWCRKGWAVIIGLALLFGLGWRPIELLAVAATPTSYAVSPEPFAVPSLVAGATLFQQQCVSCHGEKGEGDGPLAAELPVAPLDLSAPQIVAQPDGDLFWSLTVGMAGGAMPSFAALDSTQRWDLIVYLKAEREARAASSTLIAEVTANPAPRAPDFALPRPRDGAGTLAALYARDGVLLVFATLPPSQARLDQLQQWHDALDRAGITAVTITDSPRIRSAYAFYEQRPQVEEAPVAHIEFLIDRNGYIRARWRPGDEPDWTRLPALEQEIAAMMRMKLTPVAPTGHVHDG
jgi:putative copper export protein/mono/diheme cytochrome c family protein